MQQTTASTVAKSQFLAIPSGTATTDDGSYANTLIARRCDIILAAGVAPTHAVSAVAAANPTRRFLVIGSITPAGNIAVIQPGPTVQAAVAKALIDAFHGHFSAGVVKP